MMISLEGKNNEKPVVSKVKINERSNIMLNEQRKETGQNKREKQMQNQKKKEENSINRKVLLKDHDGNLDEVIDQREKPIYEHIDKPLAHELFPANCNTNDII